MATFRQSLTAMLYAFHNLWGTLAEGMLNALNAGQEAGGDIRGRQSASILVVNPISTGKIWEDRKIDLRVEDNAQPITELKRLLKIYYAFQHLSLARFNETKDFEKANSEFLLAEGLYPENPEMYFWHAVALVNNKKIVDALPIFKKVFSVDSNWKKLVPRLINAGKLKCDIQQEKEILSLNGN